MMKTRVINFYAGPGAGKSTTATAVFSLLKMHDVNCEYVPEYAKDLAWEGRIAEIGPYNILIEQSTRLERLIGKVQYIITDSPILLQSAYCPDTEFYNICDRIYKQFYNYDYFLLRSKKFIQDGRDHDEEQSIELDKTIRRILYDAEINPIFTETDPKSINNIVNDMLEILGKKLKIRLS